MTHCVLRPIRKHLNGISQVILPFCFRSLTFFTLLRALCLTWYLVVCRNVHSRSAGRHVIGMLQEHGTSYAINMSYNSSGNTLNRMSYPIFLCLRYCITLMTTKIVHIAREQDSLLEYCLSEPVWFPLAGRIFKRVKFCFFILRCQECSAACIWW